MTPIVGFVSKIRLLFEIRFARLEMPSRLQLSRTQSFFSGYYACPVAEYTAIVIFVILFCRWIVHLFPARFDRFYLFCKIVNEQFTIYKQLLIDSKDSKVIE